MTSSLELGNWVRIFENSSNPAVEDPEDHPNYFESKLEPVSLRSLNIRERVLSISDKLASLRERIREKLSSLAAEKVVPSECRASEG